MKALAFENYETALNKIIECKEIVKHECLMEEFRLDCDLASVLAKTGKLQEANQIIENLKNAPDELMGPWMQWRFYIETEQLSKALEVIKEYLEAKAFERELPEYVHGESVAYSSLFLIYAKQGDYKKAVDNMLRAHTFESAYYIMKAVNLMMLSDVSEFNKEIDAYLIRMREYFKNKEIHESNAGSKDEYIQWIDKVRKDLVLN